MIPAVPRPDPFSSCPPDPVRGRSVSRRDVLAATALLLTPGLGGAALTGCSASAPASGSAGVPEPGIQRAARTAEDLRALAQATAGRATSAADRRVLTRVVTDHGAHLEALGTTTRPGAAGSASGVESSAGSSAPASGTAAGASGPVRTLAQLAAAERDAALTALADTPAASAPVAVLLARIAAARAVHADLLTPGPVSAPSQVPLESPVTGATGATGSSPGAVIPSATAPTATAGQASGSAAGASGAPSPGPAPDEPTRAAIAALVEGQHAAVFGYGVAVARLGTRDVAWARAAWQWHSRRRDAYSAALHQAGGRVPAARAAYDVGAAAAAGADEAEGVALAGRIERGLLSTLLAAVAQVEGPWRAILARDAAEAARRLERWAGPVAALP